MPEVRKTKIILITFSALIIIQYTCCSGKEEDVVAEFGDQKITLAEFRIAYLDVIKKPDIFDSRENREKFLDELIASRILAQEAEKRGYFNDEKLRYKAEAYRNKALREAHFEAVIRPMFSISEEDIQDAYIYSQEQRKISHLYAKTKPDIDSVYERLKEGYIFEDLAKTMFSDTSLASHGGDLGWVNWDELEYDLAMTAFSLTPDTFSAPVRSQFGYHILKVTNYKKKPLITRAEYEIHRQKAKAKLEFMLGEKYGYDYINNMMSNAEIKLSPEVISTVRSKIKHLFTRQPDQFNPAGERQLTDTEVTQVETNLWDMRNESFAMINGKVYTVGEFIGALNYIPYNILYRSFKDAMNYAFRDYLIEQEARDMGLEEDQTVRNKFTLYKEYLLQLELRRDLVREVSVSEAEIKEFYAQNKAKLNGADFDQAEQIIADILKRRKRADAVPAFLTHLPENKSVKKYPEIIHRYYDSVISKK